MIISLPCHTGPLSQPGIRIDPQNNTVFTGVVTRHTDAEVPAPVRASSSRSALRAAASMVALPPCWEHGALRVEGSAWSAVHE